LRKGSLKNKACPERSRIGQSIRIAFCVMCIARMNLKKQTQLQDYISDNQELFRGFGCRKGYTFVYMKSVFYEFWEFNHEK
jgi:hypothetical protein